MLYGYDSTLLNQNAEVEGLTLRSLEFEQPPCQGQNDHPRIGFRRRFPVLFQGKITGAGHHWQHGKPMNHPSLSLFGVYFSG